MQALSILDPKASESVAKDLAQLEDRSKGLHGSTCLTDGKWYAKLTWPDWPEDVSSAMTGVVRDFHKEHPQLSPVDGDSPDWKSVFHFWESDSESAAAIGQAFLRHFGKRLRWVQSQRNRRGRIAAECFIEGIGEVVLDVSWKDHLATFGCISNESDREAMSASMQEVSKWAGRRINEVLRRVNDRLESEYGKRFSKLFVFGSYARREEVGIELPPDSDLDLAVILADSLDTSNEIERTSLIASELSLESGLILSLIPVRESDIREGRTNFARMLAREAILANG